MALIELRNNTLVFSFPAVHADARCLVDFQRTLRIPDDNQSYPLPAGLGRFPLHHVDDHQDQLPASWLRHGGVFLPMYQSEALWVNFNAHSGHSYPCAIKIATGKVNALTGQSWQPALVAEPQDYVVVPAQRWLDGYAVDRHLIRQFVAMPLGEGDTAEEQLTGAATHGGIQLLVYPMKREHYRVIEEARAREAARWTRLGELGIRYSRTDHPDTPIHEMGLAPGGLMTQDIAPDPYGIAAWGQTAGARCFIHITHSRGYQAITGLFPPQQPLTVKDYTEAGIPWFKCYGADEQALPGSTLLANLDSVAARFIKRCLGPMPHNTSVKAHPVVSIVTPGKVREGDF